MHCGVLLQEILLGSCHMAVCRRIEEDPAGHTLATVDSLVKLTFAYSFDCVISKIRIPLLLLLSSHPSIINELHCHIACIAPGCAVIY